MAGANISGDLKNPSTAIPKGTLLAILTTTIIYLVSLWITGATCVRDAHGLTQNIINAANDSGILASINCTTDWDNGDCEYGLMNFFRVMEDESAFGPLIQAGIFAATLSSALASLVSAPKIFQAVCRDNLLPKIHVFGKGYGTQDEPRRAYILVFVITMAVICIGDLNVIAPIISNFFLGTYALINYASFDASFARSPGWRPTFKYYNQWVSLFGGALCIVVMFVMSWWTALITAFVFVALFVYILHRKPEANWGSSMQANNYRSTLLAMLKLTNSEDHVKNYRPQVLVMTGNPAARAALVDFAYNITKGRSLMVCGHIVPYDVSDRVFFCLSKLEKLFTKWLENRKVKAFYNPIANATLSSGTDILLQMSGLGKLKPNVLLMGFKGNWNANKLEGLDDINEYFKAIRDAFDSNVGVAVLRNGNGDGLDYSEMLKENNLGYPTMDGLLELLESHAPLGQGLFSASVGNLSNITPTPSPNWSSAALNKLDDSSNRNSKVFDFDSNGARNTLSPPGITTVSSISQRKMTASQRELTATIDRYRTKVKNAVIDVWWLYDDGGLTLFIPHLLTLEKSYLQGAKIRVFTIASSHSTMEQERLNMVELLKKFRIQFMEVFVIPDMSKKPSDSLIKEFDDIVAPFRSTETDSREGMISDSELAAQKNRTDRHLRLRELMLQNSSQAELVV
uniref:Solute carrier family 12 member 2 n=1 Tax=Plectus sambesii TaxID=2011161 RepID=A0A914X9Q7_9BILA